MDMGEDQLATLRIDEALRERERIVVALRAADAGYDTPEGRQRASSDQTFLGCGPWMDTAPAW
jgi:hypothetical protein